MRPDDHERDCDGATQRQPPSWLRIVHGPLVLEKRLSGSVSGGCRTRAASVLHRASVPNVNGGSPMPIRPSSVSAGTAPRGQRVEDQVLVVADVPADQHHVRRPSPRARRRAVPGRIGAAKGHTHRLAVRPAQLDPIARSSRPKDAHPPVVVATRSISSAVTQRLQEGA